MKITLRNLALAVALSASCASFAETVTTLWEDNFEWLEPWSKWKSVEDNKPACGDAVGDNNPSSEAKNLNTPYTGTFADNTVVTAYQALVNKGYDFVACHEASKGDRVPGQQIYLQKNYLKFGLTGYYSGIVIPVNQAATCEVFVEFDWCSQRQGTGVFDPTELVVIVKNGENEVQFPVPFKQYAENAPMSWTHEKIALTGATVNAATKIIIRNADSQWPGTGALRWYIDNIKVTDVNPLDIVVSEDFEWFGIDYAGRAINNCPDETFDEIALNEPGKASKWSSSQYYGPWSDEYPEDYITAYDYMTRTLGYEMEYVKAEGKKARANIGSTVYIMQNYVKFGLTGYQSNISFPATSSVEGTATLSFDWAPQFNGSGVYDPVELVVTVRNGSTVKKTFAVPASTLADGEAIRWLHVELPLEGVEINKGDFIQIGHAASQWPDARALRWYLDNVKVMGKSKGDAEAPYVAPVLFIKSGDENIKFESDYQLSLTGAVTYTCKLPTLSGKIQITNADGTITLGKKSDGEIENETRYPLAFGNYTVDVPQLTDVTVVLTYYRDHKYAPKLTVSGTAPAVVKPGSRKAYAYDLSASLGQNAMLTVNYKSTDNAKGAALLLFPEEGDAIVYELPVPVKGENTATVSVADVKGGSYMWQINITSELEGDEAVIAYRSPAEWFGTNNIVSGGVVWIRDTTSPAYGYTVVGFGKAQGFAVYDPAGTPVTETPVHVGFSGLDANNIYAVARGDAHGGLAVFTDYANPYNTGDKGAGAWVIDPLNPTAEPYNMFMPEGALVSSDGVITYDAQRIGSTSTTIAFQGDGDDTKVFCFDRNLFSNTLVRYDLGDNKYITEPPTMKLTNYKSIMANLDIEVEPISSGFFVSQIRNDFNSNVFGLMYFTDNGVKVWDIANKGVIGDATGHGISSGIAVNADETRLALSGYNEIYVFDLEFDANDLPVLSNPLIIPVQPVLPGVYRMQLVFDAADNLHIFSGCGQGYTVLVLPGETTASTPANEMLSLTSGLESINAATEAPVEYFNLHGFRVDGDALTPGIYIRRQGNSASKVVIK